MPPSTKPTNVPESGPPQVSFCFRCIGCAFIVESAAKDFRCPHCGNLLEITNPSWEVKNLRIAELKSIWRDRRVSNEALDLSGVWRFRELLPTPASAAGVVTLCEGNTPLYELPQASRATGV